MTSKYIEDLTAAYPGIREVWLFGSRANGTASVNSDWDYLVFLKEDWVLNALCHDLRFKRRDIDLIVVPSLGDEAISPWTDDGGYTKKLGLGDLPNGINWRTNSPTTATYREPSDRKSGGPLKIVTTFQQAIAVRVYP